MSRYSGRSRLSNRGYALNTKPRTTLLTLFYSQVIETMVRPAGIEPASYGFEVTAERSRSTGKRHRSRRYTGRGVKIKASFLQPRNPSATSVRTRSSVSPIGRAAVGAGSPGGFSINRSALQFVSDNPLLHLKGDIHQRLDVIETERNPIALYAG